MAFVSFVEVKGLEDLNFDKIKDHLFVGLKSLIPTKLRIIVGGESQICVCLGSDTKSGTTPPSMVLNYVAIKRFLIITFIVATYLYIYIYIFIY